MLMFCFSWPHKTFLSLDDIDKIISAEIPDRIVDGEMYELGEKFMIHGPCGNANRNYHCM